MIDLNDVFDAFINPPTEPRRIFRKKKDVDEIKFDLTQRMNKGLAIKDFLKTSAWRDVWREEIVKNIKSGLAEMLRPSTLGKSETEIKATLARTQAFMSIIADMRYKVEDGEQSAIKLTEMEKK